MEITFTPEEQALYENEAIIYSIIRTLDPLEKAHLNEKISDEDYHSHCKKLLNQYKMLSQSLGTDFPGLSEFMSKYKLSSLCKLAFQRLSLGITAIETGQTGPEVVSTTAVINTVQSFIMATDAIQMEIYTVSRIQPLIQDIVFHLSSVRGIPNSYQGRAKLQEWLVTLNAMRAYDDLSQEEAHQLDFDVDKAYREFRACMGE